MHQEVEHTFPDQLGEFLAQTTDAARAVSYLKSHFDLNGSDVHAIANQCFDLLSSKSKLHELVSSGQFELLLSMKNFLPWYLDNGTDVPMVRMLTSVRTELLDSDSTSLSIPLHILSDVDEAKTDL